jgi:predicted nucleotidyltransferase
MPMLRPAERLPEFNTESGPDLVTAWNDSSERIRQIRTALHGKLPDFVCCAAVSGSLARMEAHGQSDVDLIVVIDDRTKSVSETEATSAFVQAWDQLARLGALRPKSGGIYSVCARWKDLIDPIARGRIDEDITTFGHRIQLLMDAQPVACDEQFEAVQRSLLGWYTETQLAQVFDEPGPFHWLWQDVQRYWRSLRSRTCWIHADDDARAVMLNVKLRSSRLLLVFAFLQMLDRVQTDSSLPADGLFDSIVESLTLTPVERLFGAAQDIQHWNTIWTFLRDWPTQPTSELPAHICTAMSQLSTSIRNIITNDHATQPGVSWLM